MGKFLTITGLAIMLVLAKGAGGGVAIMLLLAALHTQVEWVPAWGFWACFWAGLLASVVLNLGPTPSASKES